MHERTRRILGSYGGILLLGAVGIPIGVAVGSIDAVFGRVLIAITAFRDAHVFQLVPFLALAGMLIAWAYLRLGKNTGRGMSLVFDVGLGRENVIPLRLIPLIMGGTWLTHLFGGSAGREGVAVQIGATLSHWIGRKLPFKNPGNTFLIVGMAAGFAGLFGTPLAATLFAIEVLVAGRLEYQALFPALTASFAASWTSRSLGLEKFEVALAYPVSLDAATLGRVALLGVAFGVVGGLFAWCLKWAKAIAAAHLEHPVRRIAVMGVCLSLLFLLLWQGRYCGLGTNLISASFSGDQVLPWDWALKFALTILTLAAGFQGGRGDSPLRHRLLPRCRSRRPRRSPHSPRGSARICRGLWCRDQHALCPHPHWHRGVWLLLPAPLLRGMRGRLPVQHGQVHLLAATDWLAPRVLAIACHAVACANDA